MMTLMSRCQRIQLPFPRTLHRWHWRPLRSWWSKCWNFPKIPQRLRPTFAQGCPSLLPLAYRTPVPKIRISNPGTFRAQGLSLSNACSEDNSCWISFDKLWNAMLGRFHVHMSNRPISMTHWCTPMRDWYILVLSSFNVSSSGWSPWLRFGSHRKSPFK